MQHSESHSAARQLRETLAAKEKRIVLAESCTGGRIAATLCELPGISSYLCGSFVVYRNSSKQAWLGIGNDILDDPSIGPVSPEASRLLAAAALQATPEADIALAITGDVGPGAPPRTDGKCFLAISIRGDETCEKTFCLSPNYPANSSADSDLLIRTHRLQQATTSALKFVISAMER
ncbi:MAG: hypothetical protein Aurels2KO_46950 [Aureliella sp.]